MMELVAINESKTFTSEEIQVIEEKTLAKIKELAELTKQQKAIEKVIAGVKKELEKQMNTYKVKTMDCPYIKFTRVDAGEDKEVLDVDALQENEPELYEELLADYHKTKKGKSAYVTFSVK